MTILKLFTIAIIIGFSAAACSGDAKVTSERVESSIDRELGSGSSAADIEQFFRNHNLPYTYDEFSKRYQSIIRDVSSDRSVDHAIVIYIYVDDAKKFVRAEVRDSYT